MVAPITAPAPNGKLKKHEIWFPAGQWWDVSHSELITGPGVYEMAYTIDEIPYFYRAGSVIPLYPEGIRSVTEKPLEMVIDVVGGSAGTGVIYEDRGDNSDYASSYALTNIHHNVEGNREIIVIEARFGDEKGLQTNRSYELKVYNVARPIEVYVDGTEIGAAAYEYIDNVRTLKVKMPQASCKHPRKLELVY